MTNEFKLGEVQTTPSLFGSKSKVITREFIAEAFSKGVDVLTPVLTSNYSVLSYRDRKPERAARIATTMLDVFIETLYQEREERINTNLDWLRRTFKKLEQEVVDSTRLYRTTRENTTPSPWMIVRISSSPGFIL